MGQQGRLGLAALIGSALLCGAGCGAASTHSASTGPVSSTTSTTTTVSLPTVPSSAKPTTPPTTAPPTESSRIRPPPSPSTTVAIPAAAKLRSAVTQLCASLPTGRYSVSAVQSGSGTPYVVVGRDISTSQSVIDVDAYVNGAFVPVATNIGLAQNLDPVVPGPVVLGKITTSPLPDFLVLLRSSGGGTGVVLSDVNGYWHILTLANRGGPAASAELINPHFNAFYVTQAVSMCSSCAQGNYYVTTYGYDAGSGQLVQVGQTGESPTT